MKKILLLGLVVIIALFAFALIGCSGSKGETTEEPSAEQPALKLKVATDPTFAPMEFVGDDNEVTGFDVELMSAIAEKMGADVEFITYGWDPLLAAVSSGSDEIDFAISSMTITPEREESILFSSPYFVAFQALAVPLDSTITSVDDLKKGDTVAVQRSTTGNIWADENLKSKGIKVKPYDGGNDCFTAMASGEAEAIVIDNFVAAEYSAQEALKSKVIGDIKGAEQENFGIAFPKANTELCAQVNEALASVIDDGTYLELYKKWFNAEPVMP